MSDSLWPHGLYSQWNSPGQNTGVSSHSLLQGIFPTQGLNSGLPHCRWILYQLSHKESPKILDWVAYPFSSGSSRPRNWTRVSCIAGIFFTTWAIREARRMSSSFQSITLAVFWVTQLPLSLLPSLPVDPPSSPFPSQSFIFLLKVVGVSLCCLHIWCLSSRTLTTHPFLPIYPNVLCHIQVPGKGQL